MENRISTPTDESTVVVWLCSRIVEDAARIPYGIATSEDKALEWLRAVSDEGEIRDDGDRSHQADKGERTYQAEWFALDYGL